MLNWIVLAATRKAAAAISQCKINQGEMRGEGRERETFVFFSPPVTNSPMSVQIVHVEAAFRSRKGEGVHLLIEIDFMPSADSKGPKFSILQSRLCALTVFLSTCSSLGRKLSG